MAASNEDFQNLSAVCEILKELVSDGNFDSSFLLEKVEELWELFLTQSDKAEFCSLVLDNTIPHIVKAVLNQTVSDFEDASRLLNVLLLFISNSNIL